MNGRALFLTLLVPSLIAAAPKLRSDRPGGQDHPLFARFPGFVIDRYKVSVFDRESFPVEGGRRDERLRLEGRRTFIDYQIQPGHERPSPAEVVRRHIQAVQELGGEVVWEKRGGTAATLRVRQGGGETWAHIQASGGCSSYHLTIMEKGTTEGRETADEGPEGLRLRDAAGMQEVSGGPEISHSRNGSFKAAPTPLSFPLPGGIRLDLAPVPAGTFQMGSPASELYRAADEGPQHSVTITRAFHMGKFEVTRAQWHAVMGSDANRPLGDRPDHPAVWVSYEAITAGTGGLPGFLARLNALTADRRPAGKVFRLPTEAEWEYAARAGTTTRYYWNDNPSDQHIGSRAWYSGNSGGGTHPVGGKLPNAWGFYDMAGNVYEWCHDLYGAYGSGHQADPTGARMPLLKVGPYATPVQYVVRGGAWTRPHTECRSATRFGLAPAWERQDLGFRVVLASPLSSMLP